MKTRSLLALALLTLLCMPAFLGGQSRRTRDEATSRSPAAPYRRNRRDSTPPNPEPGDVVPPRQGYVAPPETQPPGKTVASLIPSDPLDRAYWEYYDRERQVNITGQVTKVDWENPTSYIYVMASGTEWAVESSFIHFRQANVTPAVRVGDTITILGYLPKDEPGGELPGKTSPVTESYLKANHLIRAGEITTIFGQKLLMGRPPSDAEMAERLKCSALGC